MTKNSSVSPSKKLKSSAFLLLVSGLAWGGCAQEQIMQPQAPATSAAINGNWKFLASDGEDISSYGITYTFDDQAWRYSMPNVGTKVYSYTASDGNLSAALISSSFPSNEKTGTSFDAAYRVAGDTLEIAYDGHVGTLVRQNETAKN